LYEWNDLATALDVAQQGLALARRWGSIESLAGAYTSLILVRIACREFDSALASIQEMMALYGTPGPYPRRPVALEAQARLAMGDVAGAGRCAAELVPHTDEQWRLSNLIPVYVAQFRQGARASLDDVLGFLARSVQDAEEAGTTFGMAQMLAWQAVALHALDRLDQARSVLTRALSIAEPQGHVRTFVDEGTPMGELLAAVLAAQRTPRGESDRWLASYAGRLLATLTGKTFGQTSAAPPMPMLVEPLSAREMEVLRLLASTLSTLEIARELVVSANTVHSHVKSIYGKLNVHGRIEALERARELGLLP